MDKFRMTVQKMLYIITSFLILTFGMLILPIECIYGQNESDKKIFKDFTSNGRIMVALRSNKKPDGTPRRTSNPDMKEFYIEIDDLDKAIGADYIAQYWGGHIGTSDQKFKLNGNDFIQLPQIKNTPTEPQCYHRNILGAMVSIPLDHLKEGTNIIQFSLGPQTCYSFNWAWFWLYAATIRVYYDESKPHPTGCVTVPASGGTIGDNQIFEAEVTSPNDQVILVHFIGYYDDFDWKGTGEFRQWHYQYYDKGELKHNLAHTRSQDAYTLAQKGRAPFKATLKNKMIPDQTQPMKIKAIITDNTGMNYVTDVVDNVTLDRKNRSVKMYASKDVPEKFGVRAGKRMTCTISIDNDLSYAKSATLLVSTWSAATDDGSRHEIGINDVKLSDNFGEFHADSYDYIHIPLRLLKQGTNEIYIYSEFRGHALEVNWLGPVILIEYDTNLK